MLRRNVRTHGGLTAAVRLSRREALVLRLLCEGITAQEIAFRLRLAESTTRWYISTIRRLLDISSRSDLCRWALQHPQAFRGAWVDARLHPLACSCGSRYCQAVRHAWGQILAS